MHTGEDLVGSWLAGPGAGAFHSVDRPYVFRALGRFEGRGPEGTGIGLDASKMHHVLAYLLVRYERPHRREPLAQALWPSFSPAQARKNLRHSLWMIQARILGEPNGKALLLKDRDWVQINRSALWLDVVELTNAFDAVQGVPGERLNEAQVHVIERAIGLYRGDLLEGWSQDWCVYERERLRVMYLSLLEKLLGYCEFTADYERGLAYGERLLGHDRAHERAHRRMMLLNYRAGNRTGALRQYQRCCHALQTELGVGPSESTRSLHDQIRKGAAASVVAAAER